MTNHCGWPMVIKRLTFTVRAMDILEMVTKSRAKFLRLQDWIYRTLPLSSS